MAHWISDECGLVGRSVLRLRIPVGLKTLGCSSLLLDQLRLSTPGGDTWVPIHYGIGNATVHVITF